jgi:hypothetical protein
VLIAAASPTSAEIARALKVKPLELLQGGKLLPRYRDRLRSARFTFVVLVARSSLRVSHSLVCVRKSSPTANPFGLWARQ